MYNPIFHLPQFAFGMALGFMFLFGPQFSIRTHTVMMHAGAIAVVLFFGLRLAPALSTWADPFITIPFGLVILGGARAGGATADLLMSRMFTLLGEASYSIYILHVPVAFWWQWGQRNILNLGLPPAMDFILYFALLIIISVTTFLAIETPMRRWIVGPRFHRAA